MLTDKDVEKLIDVFATRKEVATKKDLEKLRKDFSDLQTSIDGYVEKTEKYKQEEELLSHKVDRHEKWIEKAADKIGIKIEYL